MIVLIIFLIGIIIGSFFNVLIDRTILHISIIYPPSYCDFCKKKLKPYNLIPIISYIIQRGKCNYCNEKIKIQYPIIEFLSGVVFIINYILIENIFIGIILSIIIMMIISMSIIDYRTRYIYIGHMILLFLLNMVLLNFRYWIKIDIVIKLVFLAILIIMGIVLSKRKMVGFGDFILIGILTLNMYFSEIAVFFIILSIIGIMIGLYAVIRRRDIKFKIPFVPIITISYLITLYGILINYKIIN